MVILPQVRPPCELFSFGGEKRHRRADTNKERRRAGSSDMKSPTLQQGNTAHTDREQKRYIGRNAAHGCRTRHASGGNLRRQKPRRKPSENRMPSNTGVERNPSGGPRKPSVLRKMRRRVQRRRSTRRAALFCRIRSGELNRIALTGNGTGSGCGGRRPGSTMMKDAAAKPLPRTNRELTRR
jgi:hypothetical protein